MFNIKNIYEELHWKEAEGYPTGTRMKILRNENGFKTVLLKLPKGYSMQSHSHIFNEQHLVISGEYESEGEVFTSGDYRIIKAHNDHGPFTSKHGAVILVIWDPAK